MRTPGKSERKEEKRTVLGDVANTPRRNLELENYRGHEEDKSDISSLDDREKVERKVSVCPVDRIIKSSERYCH